MSDDLAVSPAEITRRCLSGECPDCGGPLPAGKPWSFPTACPHCGMVLRRHDGFFLGASVFNYGITAFGALPISLFAWKMDWVPPRVALALVVTLGVALPILSYRLSWRMWLAVHYAFLPKQLPANGAKDADTDD